MKKLHVVVMSLCILCCLGWLLNVFAAQYDPLVENAQKRLAELKYEVGTADGKLGPKTIEAIKKFQHDQGLAVTGKLDEETIKKLGVTPQVEGTTTTPSPAVTEYRPVDPAELSFELKGVYTRSAIKNGIAQTVGGAVEELICEGKKVELVRNEFDGEFLETKQYGKIKIQFSSSLTSSGFSVWLTPQQKEALIKAFKPTSETADEYKPVHYSEILCAFENPDYRKGSVNADGVITPDGGKIGEVYCSLGNSSGHAASAKKIDLMSDKFEKGYVHTKQFGKIKVIFRESDGQYIIFLTDKQKAEIIRYLSQ
jgi:hypothetical protein